MQTGWWRKGRVEDIGWAIKRGYTSQLRRINLHYSYFLTFTQHISSKCSSFSSRLRSLNLCFFFNPLVYLFSDPFPCPVLQYYSCWPVLHMGRLSRPFFLWCSSNLVLLSCKSCSVLLLFFPLFSCPCSWSVLLSYCSVMFLWYLVLCILSSCSVTCDIRLLPCPVLSPNS